MPEALGTFRTNLN